MREFGIFGFRFVIATFAFCVLASAFSAARADVLRTQTLQLQRGWNAVFLEVYPSESNPAALFSNSPIDIVASHYALTSSSQFVTDPGAEMFRNGGWGVWYAEGRPDAFLKTLHAIYGQQAYLIHARQDYQWQVTGTVVLPEIRWRANAYNFVGFGVHPQAGPTFAQFFGGSKAHRELRIYRLTSNNNWRRVTDASAETMRSGEGFWIYCDGASGFQGPLRLETTTRHGLVLGSGRAAVILRNDTSHPLTPVVGHVPNGADAVPLSIVIQGTGDREAIIRSISVPQPDGAWMQPLPPLEAGGAVRVPFELRRQDMQSWTRSSLLKVTSDLGTEVWIPVMGVRSDLAED